MDQVHIHLLITHLVVGFFFVRLLEKGEAFYFLVFFS
jgi:hypothetical protein